MNIKILEKAKVVTLSSNTYRINQYSHFGYKFYKAYKKIFKVRLTKKFEKIAKFLEEVDTEFNAGKFKQGFSRLKNELWIFAILETHKKFKIDFSDYIASQELNVDNREIYSFSEAYSTALPYLNINPKTFYLNSKQLIKWTKSDANINISLGIVLNGIKAKTISDSKFGLECFEYAINEKEIEIDLLIPLISGLYSKKGISFFENYLEKLINKEEYSVSIICGLSNVDSIEKEEAELFLKLYEEIDKKNPNILIQLPKLLFAILGSNKLRKNSKYFKICFSHLNELISTDNQNIIYFILRTQEYKSDHIEERVKLTLNLIEKPHFTIKKHLRLIDQFLWDLKDIRFFEKVVNALAVNCSFQPVSEYLNTSIYEFMKNNKVDFDKCLIKLLTNDKASRRFLGLNIFNEISQHNYTFEFDILSLNHLDQYKLWVSVCQSYREPKYVIPCLIPLFKSSSSLVKEAFICKMEEYSENYGGFVTDEIKSNLDLNDQDSKDILERIETHRDQFYSNNILVKQNIKELNPFYTQFKGIKQYDRLFQKQINQSFKEAEKNSIFGMIGGSNVILAKGGGWKLGNRKGISKLGTVGASFSLPRDYFINPTEFDLHNNYELHRDWTDSDFKLIKEYLKNE
ncbi:MAG: hypothetical protein KQH79_17435 [Bacteroidetes bacterium]|nr:hypothetical protein [Bacteroidota bacterium]